MLDRKVGVSGLLGHEWFQDRDRFSRVLRLRIEAEVSRGSRSSNLDSIAPGPASILTSMMTKRVLNVCGLLALLALVAGCEPGSSGVPLGEQELATVAPERPDATAGTPPDRPVAAPDEDDYRRGRPEALMDFLFRHRPTEIPPPGMPIHELDLTNLMLDAEVLDAIASLSGLKALLLGGSNIDDEGIARLGELRDLVALGLRRTLVTDACLPRIAALPRLEVLYLSDTTVTDAGLGHLSAAAGLRQLALSGSRVTAAGLSAFQGPNGLERLWLESTPADDRAVSAIVRAFPRLEIVSLGSTEVSDGAVSKLALLPALKVLDLSSTSVSDSSVDVLAAMSSLRLLDLRDSGVSPVGLDELVERRPDLDVKSSHHRLLLPTATGSAPAAAD